MAWSVSEGDTLTIWKLDRSVKEELTIADDLHDRGAGVENPH